MNEPTDKKPIDNRVALNPQQQEIFRILGTLVEEGRVYQERMAASVAIARGELAHQIRSGLTGMVASTAGIFDPAAQYQIAPDCSSITKIGGSPMPLAAENPSGAKEGKEG